MRCPLPTPQAIAVSDAKIASVLSAAVEVHPPANPVDATLPTPFPTDGERPSIPSVSLPCRRNLSPFVYCLAFSKKAVIPETVCLIMLSTTEPLSLFGSWLTQVRKFYQCD